MRTWSKIAKKNRLSNYLERFWESAESQSRGAHGGNAKIEENDSELLQSARFRQTDCMETEGQSALKERGRTYGAHTMIIIRQL